MATAEVEWGFTELQCMWCSWAQPIGRADCQMAARLFCNSRVSAGHLSAAHLKRWASHFMPKLKLHTSSRAFGRVSKQ